MKKRMFLAALLLAVLALGGCGGGGGTDDAPLTGTGGGGTGGGGTGGGGTGGGGTGGGGTGGGGTGGGGTTPPPTTTPGQLGALVDMGDLLGSVGDNWYQTYPTAYNDVGQVVGASIGGAFVWDQGTGAMSPLTSHGGPHDNYGTYDDYFHQKTSSPSTDAFQRSEAVGINNSGVIIGNSSAKTLEESRGFVIHPTLGFVDLTPGSSVESGKRTFKSYSKAVDINNKGQVVLTRETSDGKYAFFWDGITFDTLGSVFDDNSVALPDVKSPRYFSLIGVVEQGGCDAVAINDHSQAIANCGSIPTFTDFSNGGSAVLNALPGASEAKATAINEKGYVVGSSGGRAFFWDGGAMYPLGSLSGGSSEALAINNNDWVVGTSTDNGVTHAVLWKFNTTTKKSTIQDLGTLGGTNSYAVAINDQGVVVGYSDTGETYQENGTTLGVQRAFVWKSDVMYDLGTHNDFYNYYFVPPYPISRGVGINAVGQVVGNSITINSHKRAFFLTPVYP